MTDDSASPRTALPQQVLHSMPWAVLALDRGGVFRLVNAPAEELLGSPAAAVLGQPLSSALLPDLPDELHRALHEAVRAAEPVAGEFFLPHCQRWIEMTTQPGATQVLVYWQDVTRLMTLHQQYRALADNSPDAISRWGPDLRLQYANPALGAQAGRWRRCRARPWPS